VKNSLRNNPLIDDLVYDPADPETLRNPHAIFAKLRADDPVHWSDPMQAWIVTRYDLAGEVLIDAATYSAERLGTVRKHLPAPVQDIASQILRWLGHWMVFRDPPDHTRLRRHMNGVLNLPVFEALRGSIQGIAGLLLDDLPRGEIVDVIPAFSIQLPGMVIMDLMGVPRERLLEVKSWSDNMMLFIGSARGVPDKYERARGGAVAMASLFQGMIEERRAVPRDDMLSQLIDSEAGGERLNDDELIGSLMMVLNGGHETTANLINNSLLAMAHNPDQVTTLRQSPDGTARAVDEFLRYDSPVLSIGRVVSKETELGGKQLSPGERIFAMLVAANRDGDVFANPDTLDLTRSPNPHMAFGKGHHFCLGTPLARIEGQIAVEYLLERFSKIELAEPVGDITWINSMVTRGPTRLPMKLS
jgi:cytochrome P450